MANIEFMEDNKGKPGYQYTGRFYPEKEWKSLLNDLATEMEMINENVREEEFLKEKLDIAVIPVE